MTSIAIIGTAGRNEDGPKIDRNVYDLMIRAALNKAIEIEPDRDKRVFVSGGAAVADHIAVHGYLKGHSKQLILQLPAKFNTKTCKFEGSRDADICNYYHNNFYKRTDIESLEEIAEAIDIGAVVRVHNGFFDRNGAVALAQHIIALTFGSGVVPKSGGTKNTWDIARTTSKFHIPIGTLRNA